MLNAINNTEEEEELYITCVTITLWFFVLLLRCSQRLASCTQLELGPYSPSWGSEDFCYPRCPKLTFFRRWRFFFTPGGPKLTCFDPKKSPLLTGNPTNHLDVYIFSSFGSIFSPLVSIFNLTNRQRHCWERFSDLVTLIVTLTVNDWQTERGMDSIRNYCDVFPQNTLRIRRNILSFLEYYGPIVFD